MPQKKKSDAKSGTSTAAIERKLRTTANRMSGDTDTKRPKLMVSYCHLDKDQAEEIATRLSAHFDILIDKNYFELSRSTRPEMKRMVGDADVVLVLLTPDSVGSDAVRFEVSCALAREQIELRKVLFGAMIRKCSSMPEWPDERLWANLHSDYKSEYRKLIRSLIGASKKALPKATAAFDSCELHDLAVDLISQSGFTLRERIQVLGYSDELPDNALAAQVLNTDNYCYFSSVVATYLGWTILLYFPQIALNGRWESRFAHDRFAIRVQIDSRLGGYTSYKIEHPRGKKEPKLEELIQVFKRNPKVIDVVLSPHSIGRKFASSGNLQSLTWQSSKAALFFHSQHSSVGPTSLPVFIAPLVRNASDLKDSIRCLKAALRIELNRRSNTPSKWHFVEVDYRSRWRSIKRFGKEMRQAFRKR